MTFFSLSELSVGKIYFDHPAENGITDLSSEKETLEGVFSLSGKWEVFRGVNATPSEIQIKQPELIPIPFKSFERVPFAATFRLNIKTGDIKDTVSLFFINRPEYNTKVYWNGKLVKNISSGNADRFFLSQIIEDLYIDNSKNYQELVIGTDNASNLMYHNLVILGPYKLVGQHVEWTYAFILYMFGFLLSVITTGLIFLYLHSGKKIMTYFTIFDCLVSLRLVLASLAAFSFMNTFLGISLGSMKVISKLTFIVLLLLFLVEIFLVMTSFHVKSSKLTYFLKAVLVLSILLVILLPSSSESFLVAFLPSAAINIFVGLTYVLYISRKRLRSFSIFDPVKHLYFILLVTYDILFLLGLVRYTKLLIYGYILLLIIHVLYRMADNYKAYARANELNSLLEQKVEERITELTAANDKLSDLLIRDPLTNAYNRLHFDRELQQILENTDALQAISLCVMDVDHFKMINDTYGHAAGDIVLIETVELIKRQLPKDTFLARIGGEEFAMLFIGPRIEEVIVLIEKICDSIEHHTFSNGIKVTASFGIAKYKAGMDATNLFKTADDCLYDAKDDGRNCVRYSFV